MPITKSAKRALKKSLKRRKKNLKLKEEIKESLKGVKKLIAEKKIEETKKNLPKVFKILDKAAKVGVIKKGKANRVKSKISKSISKSQKLTNQEQHRVSTVQS